MKQFLKKHLVEIVLYIVLFAGLCLLLYPSVSNWWNSFTQSRAIASYMEMVENTSAEEQAAMLEAARAYNARLAAGETSFLLDEEQDAEYRSLLDPSGTGVMGYIRIPAINVDLPVYHTVEDVVLQIAVGHIPGSSLPVGGADTHSLLSGHRGLPSARLFTDLNQLQTGDVFIFNILGETLTYQVDQIRIVLPEEVDQLSVVKGKDYCTLITCTPYGINTHRILVRGHRIENQTEESLTILSEAKLVPTRYVMVAVGIPLIGLTVVLLMVFGRPKKPGKTQQEMLDELKRMK